MVIGDTAWKKPDTFRYAASLDGPLLAWEYLRRSPAYRAAWIGRELEGYDSSPAAWGLLSLVDPELDGRHANPVWQPDPPRRFGSFGRP
jgi:hypothetical protein